MNNLKTRICSAFFSITINKLTKIVFIIISLVFGIIGLVSSYFIVFNESYLFNASKVIDTKLASEFGDFFGGFVGTIFSIMSVLLLIYTILHQNRESRKSALETNFFRMIDYHNLNVNQLKVPNLDKEKVNDFYEGRRAFVQFKIQIHRLFAIVREVISENNFQFTEKQIADIVYIIFFYGIEGSWVSFIQQKLDRYAPNHIELAAQIQAKINLNPKLNYGRTNQTNLSTYFRNMYNAIKLIDSAKFLKTKEKEELIKIYRAQLSNPELYILFFNLISRFGKNWEKHGYITTYKFIQNIPQGYCENYDLNAYFKMDYENDYY